MPGKGKSESGSREKRRQKTATLLLTQALETPNLTPAQLAGLLFVSLALGGEMWDQLSRLKCANEAFCADTLVVETCAKLVYKGHLSKDAAVWVAHSLPELDE